MHQKMRNQTALIKILIGNDTITLRCRDVTLDFDTEAEMNLITQ